MTLMFIFNLISIGFKFHLLKQIMKHSMFKIRTVGSNQKAPKVEDLSEVNQGYNQQGGSNKIKIDELLTEIKKMIEASVNKEAGTEFEARDRHVSLEENKLTEDKLNSDQIEAWIGKVCRDVMSSAYYYYLNKQMNYQQTKIYCCQQILKGISRFVENNPNQISPQFYATIDQILKEKIFPYLQLKYPPSVSKQVNKRLNKVFKEINNMEVITNDFFYNSDISFQYRESGVYNDLIMQVINRTIKIADINTTDDKESDNRTNFEDFEDFMSEMFEKVYDYQWMVRGKNLRASKSINYKEQQQRQAYKEQVKEYTHYLIGRKIPENVQEFDQSEIKSGFINIKSPTILRIITKWCEQLWQKFENQNYYIDRTEGLAMLKGKQVNIMYPWLKKDLKLKMAQQKQKILQYMKMVELNNYNQQFQIMRNQQASNEALFLDKNQRICGKFSLKIVKNLQNYIIVYLNRLIHGLMEVSKLVYKQMSSMPSWPYPPNLLSFKVGDLLRCKFSSKERQVLRIFDEIQQISGSNPQKVKIIRIKNRLKLGTNDILINVLFNNCIITEIQLKVQSKSSESEFSLCSYNFSHLIYQIQRSYFGPITEMCSIWTNLDPRIKIFSKLISEQRPNKQKMFDKDSQCLMNSKEHALVVGQNNPFICSECGKAYSNNNYAIPHYKCTKCKYWKCALCTIKQREGSSLIELAIQDEELRANCKPLRCTALPIYSVGILIQSKEKEVCFFKIVEAFEKKYLFKLINQSQTLYRELNTQSQTKQFLKDYIIFQLQVNFIKKLPELDRKLAVIEQILPAYVKKCYKVDKQTLSLNSLNNFGTKQSDLIKILEGNKQQRKCIKFIEMSSNDIKQIELLSHQFSNLQFLNININAVKDLQHLAGFLRLQTLFAISNQISQIPPQLCSLNLKYLSLYDNKLTNLPPEFSQLKSLQTLRINANQLVSFPENFGKLQNLKELYANSNKISSIDNLTCPKLQHIDLNTNQLTNIPQAIQSLINLHYFNVKGNRIKEIQADFSKLKKLKEFIITSNILTQTPVKIHGGPELITLSISSNKIAVLDFNDRVFLSLKNISMQINGMNEIKGFQCLKNVESLNLGINALKTLPQDIYKLKNLRVMKLSTNKLTQLPPRIGQLTKLKELWVNSNQLKAFPSSFFTLKLEILNFSNNKFTEVPADLMSMKPLKNLQFERNAVQLLPNTIGMLQNLELLNFNYNKINQLPSQMSNLKKLKKLMYEGMPLVNLPAIILNFVTVIEGKNIKKLPQIIPTIQSVEKVSFNNNQIQVVPLSIASFVNLKQLYLNNNQITEISDVFFELKLLNTLSLNQNRIVVIPNKFDKLTQLKLLSVKQNKIQQIPSSFESLLKNGLEFQFNKNPIKQLKNWIIEYLQKNNKNEFNLQKFALTKLPNSIPSAEKHTQINLNENALQKAPEFINKCLNLKALNLSHNFIRDFSDISFSFSLLTEFDISSNKIEEIPQSFGKLKALTHLNIEKNSLKKLPQSFKQVYLELLLIDLSCFQDLSKTKSLQWIHTDKLQFSEKKIESLPQCFGQIGFLKQFQFSQHPLKGLPDSFTNIASLTNICINCKNFEELPKNIGNLSNLQHLEVMNCNLSKLPESLCNLKRLTKLFIYDTKLEQLPDHIGDLKELKEISIRTNKLTKIPNSIVQLHKLQSFGFRANKITELPVGLGRLKLIKQLFAQDNLLRIIPREFQEMKEMKAGELHLQGNPLQEIECLQYVINKGDAKTKEIAAQFKKKKEEAQQQNEQKQKANP